MATPRRCCSSSPPRRRRPAAWPEYQIDNPEPHSCAPAPSEWPTIPTHTPPPANDQLPQVRPLTSLRDLADRLRVCTATLARDIVRGKLAPHKVSGHRPFTHPHIAAYLKLT